jgi:energy-coupling factor transporter ATP-binding protein EcfA2
MVLQRLAYKEHPDTPRSWELVDFDLQEINLVVAKNAAGKSRTLNVIEGLGNLLLSPNTIFGNAHYKATFKNSQQKVYTLNIGISEGRILNENLLIDNEPQIERIESNQGRMFNQDAGKFLSFELPENQLACTRRDRIQYPYLEDIHKWADTVRRFHFNTPLGKGNLHLPNTPTNVRPINIKETERVLDAFASSNEKFDTLFKTKVIDDFNRIGYKIEDVLIGPLQSISLHPQIISNPIGLLVKEVDREVETDQHEMSMGMFRALSILIFFNTYDLEGIEGCILIDDIGEGLDYEKSTNLINLLIEKSKSSSVQLIMSTNDKFVMNNTDLTYWQILKRKGSRVKLFNCRNAKEQFEEFKFTGLNNFDFFRSDLFENNLSFE